MIVATDRGRGSIATGVTRKKERKVEAHAQERRPAQIEIVVMRAAADAWVGGVS
jgi:hypothetical protein